MEQKKNKSIMLKSAVVSILLILFDQITKFMAATGANVAESNALGDFAKVEEYEKNIEVRKVEE